MRAGAKREAKNGRFFTALNENKENFNKDNK